MAPVSGMITWLMGDKGVLDASNNPCVDGGVVSKWVDQSGNGHDMTTNRGNPLYIKSNINGLPAIRQTVSDELHLLFAYSNPVTVIYISRIISGSSRMLSSPGNNWLLGYWNGSKDRMYAEGWVAYDGTTTDSYLHIYSSVQTGSLTSFYSNGTLVASNNSGVSSPNGLGTNGGGFPGEASNGDVAEILVYSSALSDSDRLQTEKYLYDKWIAKSPYPGMSIWYMADKGVLDGSGNPCLDSSVAHTWQDQSGNNNHAIQSNGSPVFKTSILNKNPILRFDGDDGFSTTVLAPNTSGVPYSLFYVTTIQPGATGTVFGGMGGSNYRNFHLQVFGSGHTWNRWNSLSFDRIPTNLISYTCQKSNTENFWENGVLKATSTNNDSDSGNWYVGICNNGQWAFSGDIGEIILYPYAVNELERQQIERYLLNKWILPPEKKDIF